MEQNKKAKKDERLSEADIERLELLQRANEKKGKQLTISEDVGNLQEIDELRQLIASQFENPEEKYNIYYRGDYLPKGKEYKEIRDIIYDEKNVFLNLWSCDPLGYWPPYSTYKCS